MKKKTIALALVLVMAFGVTMGGTFAYLTSQDTVTNTFTVGNVQIKLDEAKVDLYGVEDENADRVTENTYKLIPGHNYTKDPTITVETGSEDCWLMVKIENGISAIATINGISEEWEVIDAAKGVYGYKTAVAAGAEVVVFTDFTVATDADVSAYATVANESNKIIVTAYAVQKDGFASAEAAWEATFGAPTQG